MPYRRAPLDLGFEVVLGIGHGDLILFGGRGRAEHLERPLRGGGRIPVELELGRGPDLARDELLPFGGPGLTAVAIEQVVRRLSARDERAPTSMSSRLATLSVSSSALSSLTSTKPSATASLLLFAAAVVGDEAGAQRGEQRQVPRQHAELAGHAGRGHVVDLLAQGDARAASRSRG